MKSIIMVSYRCDPHPTIRIINRNIIVVFIIFVMFIFILRGIVNIAISTTSL